jgi:uncharacterized protein YjbI with pentapeptide repeats
VSQHLATDVMLDAYHHQMDFAAALLHAGDVDSFNALRRRAPFVTLSLRGRDLQGLNLGGADLADADLSKCQLRGAELSGADLSRADLSGADLRGCDLTSAKLNAANLSGANLSGVHGDSADFSKALLVGALLTRISDLTKARFDGAVLSQASLFSSNLAGAHLVRADLVLASLAAADLTEVAALERVDLTGANLSGTRLDASRCSSLWMTGVTGLDGATTQALRIRGCVFDGESVVQHVAPEITAGFKAQIAEDPSIPKDLRRSTLLSMLKAYYLR